MEDMWRRSFVSIATVLLCASALTIQAQAHKNESSALWKIACRCVDTMRETGKPGKCILAAKDDGAGRGYVVLKALEGDAQLLVIPTKRLKGVGERSLLSAAAPNYWEDAWESRNYLDGLRSKQLQSDGLSAIPREDIALVINSARATTQNQLHIHVDCVRDDVQRSLEASRNKLTGTWVKVGVQIGENIRQYNTRFIKQDDLRGLNPFQMVAQQLSTQHVIMARQTVAIVGAKGTGFFLLTNPPSLANDTPAASAEELMRPHEGCGVLEASAK